MPIPVVARDRAYGTEARRRRLIRCPTLRFPRLVETFEQVVWLHFKRCQETKNRRQPNLADTPLNSADLHDGKTASVG